VLVDSLQKQEAPEERDERGRFLKGVSGNPEGRFKPGRSGNPRGGRRDPAATRPRPPSCCSKAKQWH
jgi:hypothetical protein